MVRTVFWWLIIGLVVILVLAWFISGGIAKIRSAQSGYGFFGLFSGSSAFNLPWSVPIPQGVDISNIIGTSSGQYASQNSQTQGPQSQTFGGQSSYGGTVVLSTEGASASDPQAQYVAIQNTSSQTIDISGWSLQSALTGARAYIPLGASFFEVGQLNEQSDIELAPGGVAIVTTGESPVGTSFRENECSGYLEHLQSYTPAIETQCPSPNDNAAAAAKYGQSCADLVSSLPFCSFPQTLPSGISSQCATYVQTTFSYNGCVAQYQNDSNFPLNDWRVYLGVARPLWNSDHDTIRLLDSQGETVAVTSY